MPISAKESINKLKSEVSSCKKCLDLAKTRKQAVPGTGSPKASIMVIGDCPGAEGAEKKGVPYTGDDSGKFMKKIFDQTKISFTKDLYITYLVKCTPRKVVKKKGTSTAEIIPPLERHINNCISFLTKEISIITPHIIVSLGLDVSNIILNRFFSVDKKYTDMEKIHMRIFENPSFKLVPFFDPRDVIVKHAVTEERFLKDFQSLVKLSKMV
jgi:uracil-DNA glycosylase family 4